MKTDAVSQLLCGYLFPSLPPSGGLVPIHIRRGGWGVKGPTWEEEQQWSEEHNSNKDSEILQRCMLRCFFSEQSRWLQSPPWSPVAYKSQRPLGEKRATVQCWSKDGPIISGWLCVAKWLHQLAACLSAGQAAPARTPPPPALSAHP